MHSLALFRRRLILWFKQHARKLPWRNLNDPYAVWVSEVMLQQTTVQTVQGYFNRFIAAFPTIQSLADSELESVHRHWEGLGYYRRCTLLHKAAQEIVSHHGGVFPNNYNDALNLPGIGRYTAGAILSIAFEQRLPILEANTLRLHARLLAIRGNILHGESNARLWRFAEEVLPRKDVGQFNQALMELGSLVCTSSSPKCAECPVVLFCESAKQGLQHEIPTVIKKLPKENRTEVALFVRKRGRTLLMRHASGGRWAGLWDFPRAQTESPETFTTDQQLHRRLLDLTGRKLLPGKLLCTLKHSVTKYKIMLLFCEGIDAGRSNTTPICETRWASATELRKLPMNSTARKLTGKQVEIR